MSTKASVTLQRRKLGERQGRNATGTYRITEPRSPLPKEQDMSLFQSHTPVQSSWLCLASQLQGKKGQCPATLVPSPRPGALYTGLQPPPHQASPSLSFLATHRLNHFAYAMDSSFTATECSTRRCPSKEQVGCFAPITPSHSCPESMAVGGPGQGPNSAAVFINSVFPGQDGCFSSELGLRVGKGSLRPLCKGGKKNYAELCLF